jgi:hypothetical protein
MAEIGSIKVASVNMSSRDLFAAVAMHAHIIKGDYQHVVELAESAIDSADAVIKLLESENGGPRP